MKKFLFLILAVFSLAGCSWFDRPANIEIIGTGIIQNDAGLLVVTIDSTKYAPNRIHTNASADDFKTLMMPVEGMTVTAFKMHHKPEVHFIAGHHNKEYLDEYFFRNNTLAVISLVCFSVAWLGFFYMSIRAWYNLKKREKEEREYKKKG